MCEERDKLFFLDSRKINHFSPFTVAVPTYLPISVPSSVDFFLFHAGLTTISTICFCPGHLRTCGFHDGMSLAHFQTVSCRVVSELPIERYCDVRFVVL